MAAFEIRVNGEARFIGEGVTAITLVADRVSRRKAERVSVHVGVGEEGDREVQYLGADLHAGDEISVRILSDEEAEAAEPEYPTHCSYCGRDIYHIVSMVSGGQVAICNYCVESFRAAITENAALPLGASISEEAGVACGFCANAPPVVPGVVMRAGAAICPECLRVCVDMREKRPAG